MLTAILPPSVCASCRLCCNFLPESAWETPALEPECAGLLRSQGVPLSVRADGGETITLIFAPECPQKAADCPLLDKSAGCLLPRDLRPLECRLWPLRLMRDEAGNLVVTCYRSCPGLAAVPRETLLRVAESLRPLFAERAASFPASIRPLHPNYSILFTLKQSPALPS